MSQDGRTVLYGGLTGDLLFWDAHEGKAIHSVQGHSGAVHSLAVTMDGLRALSVSSRGELKLWDVPSGKASGTWQGTAGPRKSCGFSGDGRMFYFFSEGDDRVRLFETEGPRELQPVEAGRVLSAALDPKGRRLLTGDARHGVLLWDLEAREAGRLDLSESYDFATALAFIDDGARFLAGTGRGALLMFGVGP